MTRKEYTLNKIDYKKGIGLELGPLYSPILLKSEASVSYVDHMSTADLRHKYRNDTSVPADEIVPIDYVVGGSTLKDVVGNKRFDYVVASHVIEHIPDVVSWLRDISSVLKPKGLISFVIPDKRFTFDITRRVSRPADIVGAYLDGYERPSSASMYDFSVECREEVDAWHVWNHPDEEYCQKPSMYTIAETYKQCLENRKPDVYVDAHCNVFTPYSFIEILKTLIEHNLLDYEVIGFEDTPFGQLEFYITLRKVSKPNQTEQLRSLPKLKNDSELLKLKAEVEGLTARIKILENSRSWKLTKPLRRINARVKKAR